MAADKTSTMARKTDLLELIYEKLNSVLGGGPGGQLFCMEFPARALNHHLYEYDTSSRTSVVSKPFSVAEAEFRLTDDLFDLAPVVQGPSGRKLSSAYQTLLNNYVPKLDEVKQFSEDKAKLREWLLEKDGDAKESRIERFRGLYTKYLLEKEGWARKKEEEYDKLKGKPDGLEDYARWLSTEGLVQLQGLNTAFTDAVVQGSLHEVLTYLGFLNAGSPAEVLETTKQSLRNSARLSVDESMEVLPVQLQPSDWFKAMAPNLSPKDLTMAREVVVDQYRSKLREIEELRGYLAQLEAGAVDPEQLKAAEAEVEKGRAAFAQAELDLVKQYGGSALSLFKLVLNAKRAAVKGTLQEFFKKDKPDGTDDVVRSLGAEDVVNKLWDTYKQQAAHLDAAEHLAQVRARYADAAAHDYRAEITRTRQRMETLQSDVRYLERMAGGVLQQPQPPAFENVALRANGTRSVEVENPQTHAKETKQQRRYSRIETKQPTAPATGYVRTETDYWVEGPSGALELDHDEPKGWKEKVEVVTQFQLDASTGTVNETSKTTQTWKAPDAPGPVVQLATTTHTPPPLMPQSSGDAVEDGRFMDVVLESDSSGSWSAQASESRAANSSWKVSAWFTSAGGQSSSASATSSVESLAFSSKCEIGFRVAKVAIDRGGWFNPTVFAMSENFRRVSDHLRASGPRALSKRDVLGADPDQGAHLDAIEDARLGRVSCLLPAYPVAFVVAKDITIRFKSDFSQSALSKAMSESSGSSGGGFLCFSASHASSSKSTAESAYHGQHGQYSYIRIPGPQIIGWFLEFTPPDRAESYVSLEVKKALPEDKGAGTRNGAAKQPRDTPVPPPPPQEGAKPNA